MQISHFYSLLTTMNIQLPCTNPLRLVSLFAILLVTGCIPVPIYHSVPAETGEIDVPEAQVTRMAIAPYFHRSEVQQFSESLVDIDSNVEVIKATAVLQVVFPDSDPNTERTISELLQPDVLQRITNLGLRYIVVLSRSDSKSSEDEGNYFIIGIKSSSTHSTSLRAGLIDLEHADIHHFLEAEAQGKSSATWWMLPYAGLFIFLSGDKTEESVMDGLAQELVTEIRRMVPEQPVNIMVISGDWEAAEESYETEMAKKELHDKARQGDAEAQLRLYKEAPSSTSLVWLCRSADQRYSSACNELGNLYRFGSQEYRSFAGVDQNISKACMWFHHAGQVQFSDHTKPVEVTEPQEVEDTAEMERTHISMSVDERHTAKYLVAGWHPGQCRADVLKIPENAHSNQDEMLALCKKADLGDVAARNELGYLYFFGFEGFPEDPSKSYLWYYLASVAAGSSSDKQSMQQVCDTMTKKEHGMAVRALKNWKPGQCAAEFDLAADKAPSL